MSPVDQAGLVSEIAPLHTLLYKNFDVLYDKVGCPVSKISVFATEMSVTKLEISAT